MHFLKASFAFVAIVALVLAQDAHRRRMTNDTHSTKGSPPGITSQKHDVVTADGYILQIFRVSQDKCHGRMKQPPVILMHGLLQDSDVWFDAGPYAGLGYLISNECYDLWVANQRGNFHARRHKYLNPDKDAMFWNFSVDEIGLYDIPATIDYVLNYTSAAKVNYIGFSQGCGTFYIMCSERLGYCDKVQLKISLAPATRHFNTKSVGFRSTMEFSALFQDSLKAKGINEMFAIGSPTQTYISQLCKDASSLLVYAVCQEALFFFDASHPGSINAETISRLYKNLPSGTSTQNLARYGQALKSKEFAKFDYGEVKNLELYGTSYPTPYNFSAVSVPVVVIYGNNDGIVDKKDVKWMVEKLPNLLEAYEVADPLWNHFDATDSQYVPTMTFPKIAEYLSKYSSGSDS